MKITDPAKQVCPECLNHPPLAYRHSVGSAEAPAFHFYVCPLTGIQYMLTAGGSALIRTPAVQYPQRPTRQCGTCGKTMRVEMARFPWDRLTWRCEHCGATERFQPFHLDA